MTALIIIDLQNDFFELGAMPIPNAQEIIPMANALMPYFDYVIATKDWHPANHNSFAANHLWRKPGQVVDLNGTSQILWQMHCVQNSFGAEFVDDLKVEKIDKILLKGTHVDIDSYSAFFDNGHLKTTGLKDFLQEKNVTKIFVMGLATNYCVKFTALDALDLGFETYIIKDASRGVKGDGQDTIDAFKEMKEQGVIFVNTSDFIERI